MARCLSALADGEPAGIDERLVAAHVARCPGCWSFKESIESSPAVADRAARWSILRILLAVVAVQVITFASVSS
jgi:predicted anti-sigma-YlaC factor YlaD